MTSIRINYITYIHNMYKAKLLEKVACKRWLELENGWLAPVPFTYMYMGLWCIQIYRIRICRRNHYIACVLWNVPFFEREIYAYICVRRRRVRAFSFATRPLFCQTLWRIIAFQVYSYSSTRIIKISYVNLFIFWICTSLYALPFVRFCIVAVQYLEMDAL